MRNTDKSLTKNILEHTEQLPFFSVSNLKVLDVRSYHLRIALSRLERDGRLIRLKKGFYTTKEWMTGIRIKGIFTPFVEFMAVKLYEPSYLSLEYVLHESGLLTDIPFNYTLVTCKTTSTVSNAFGRFVYHKIKDSLYYSTSHLASYNQHGFSYQKADKVRALFDYLYLRKRFIINRRAAAELRLNLNVLSKSDITTLKRLMSAEGSRQMQAIFNLTFL